MTSLAVELHYIRRNRPVEVSVMSEATFILLVDAMYEILVTGRVPFEGR